jgi:hypothetical protein
MPLLRRAGLLGAAISFARSERGQRMLSDARARIDTPANRQKLKSTVTSVRNRRGTAR